MSGQKRPSGILAWLAARAYKSFLTLSENMAQYSQKVLLEILKENRKTEYGLRYDFNTIKSIGEYQKRIPLTMYADYEADIKRMVDGAKKVLTAGRISSFGLTSGTTGKSKMVPVSGKSRKVMAARMGLVAFHVTSVNFPGLLRRGRRLNISSNVIAGFTRKGIPVGAITSSSARRMRHIQSLMNTSPVEIAGLANYQDALYLHLLFALLDSELKSISATFASTILDLFYHLELHWPVLLNDLESGTITGEIQLTSPVRESLEKKLKDRRKRIKHWQRPAELKNAFAAGLDGIASRIWPGLVCITTITSGTFQVYADKCRRYMDNIPFYSPFYAATEGFIGINLEPEKSNYTILPGTAFFEFLPVAEEAEVPTCLTIDQLQTGEEYEVVITNYSGFYRYRMGDIVKVVDHLNQLPVVEFVRRKGTLLNLAGEKTDTEAVNAALRQALPASAYRIVDYTVYPDHETLPGYYTFFMELKDCRADQAMINSLESGLEAALCETSPRYQAARAHNKLGCLKIGLLREGTFAEYKGRLTRQGVSPNQVKIPHVFTDPEKLAFFKEQEYVPLSSLPGSV